MMAKKLALSLLSLFLGFPMTRAQAEFLFLGLEPKDGLTKLIIEQ
jgi:hypothetical protein